MDCGELEGHGGYRSVYGNSERTNEAVTILFSPPRLRISTMTIVVSQTSITSLLAWARGVVGLIRLLPDLE